MILAVKSKNTIFDRSVLYQQFEIIAAHELETTQTTHSSALWLGGSFGLFWVCVFVGFWHVFCVMCMVLFGFCFFFNQASLEIKMHPVIIIFILLLACASLVTLIQCETYPCVISKKGFSDMLWQMPQFCFSLDCHQRFLNCYLLYYLETSLF